MPAVALRAADAYNRAASPLLKSGTTPRRAPGLLEAVVGLAIMFAVAAAVVALRVGIYAVTHSDQPMFARFLDLFR
jgi:hypothetical protein